MIPKPTRFTKMVRKIMKSGRDTFRMATGGYELRTDNLDRELLFEGGSRRAFRPGADRRCSEGTAAGRRMWQAVPCPGVIQPRNVDTTAVEGGRWWTGHIRLHGVSDSTRWITHVRSAAVCPSIDG